MTYDPNDPHRLERERAERIARDATITEGDPRVRYMRAIHAASASLAAALNECRSEGASWGRVDMHMSRVYSLTASARTAGERMMVLGHTPRDCYLATIAVDARKVHRRASADDRGGRYPEGHRAGD